MRTMKGKLDFEVVESWLNAGGSEIVFDVIRRMGWRVTVVADDWELSPEWVAISSRSEGSERTDVNGNRSGYEQTAAVLSAFLGIRSYGLNSCGNYPIFEVGDQKRLSECGLLEIFDFCETVMFAYESIKKPLRAGEKVITKKGVFT